MTDTKPVRSRKRARSESPPPLSISEASSRTPRSTNPKVKQGVECPYMDTINRTALDFDFEHVCSVSLEKHNVYACLTCGKFFQGRGPSSHAYAHTLDADHHLFINLQTEQVYCIPEMYIVEDPGFADIVNALRPKFMDVDITALDRVKRVFRVLDGAKRLQGVVGIDNLKATDYAGVVIQFLFCIPPIRDFLLRSFGGASMDPRSELLDALATLARKVWSPSAFRAHISPHEIMQVVARVSKQRFVVHKQADPVQFLAWLLNFFSNVKSSADSFSRSSAFAGVLRACFQGKMLVTSVRNDEANGGMDIDRSVSNPFWFLTLELPPKPLFKDRSESALVPQVPLHSLLKKYDGVTRHHIVKSGEQKAYKLTYLPVYLVLTVKRLVRSKFAFEKNPCVVHLPVNNLDIEDAAGKSWSYSLTAVIIHDGDCENGSYRIALLHRATGHWFDIRDMTVKKTMPQLVTLAETYVLLYSREPRE